MNLLKFFADVGKLKTLKRAGWVIRGIKNAESVAEHSYRTAVLAMAIADKLKISSKNKLQLIEMALIHDLGEAYVGDIVPEQSTSKQKKHLLEKKAQQKIFANLENGEYYYKLWLEYERSETKVSKLLHQLDKLEMVIQALEYQKLHKQKKFDEFIQSAREKIVDKEIKKLLERLLLKR